METPAKERLTGALILFAALALIVPEIFSGPDRDAGDVAQPAQSGAAGPPLRTYEMALDGAGTEASSRQGTLTPQAGAPVAQIEAVPPPVTHEPAAVAPEAVAETAGVAADAMDEDAAITAKPAAEPDAPKPAPAPAVAAKKPEAAPAVAAATGGRWWVQLGSFSSRENVEKLVKQLRADGIGVDVSQIRSGSKELQRVRAGPVRDREAAVKLQSRLTAAGHRNTTLVAP